MYRYIVVPTNIYTFTRTQNWDGASIEHLLILELTVQYTTYSEYSELRSIKPPIGWPRLSDYSPNTRWTYDNDFIIQNFLYFNTLEELESFILYKTL